MLSDVPFDDARGELDVVPQVKGLGDLAAKRCQIDLTLGLKGLVSDEVTEIATLCVRGQTRCVQLSGQRQRGNGGSQFAMLNVNPTLNVACLDLNACLLHTYGLRRDMG